MRPSLSLSLARFLISNNDTYIIHYPKCTCKYKKAMLPIIPVGFSLPRVYGVLPFRTLIYDISRIYIYISLMNVSVAGLSCLGPR